MQIIAELNDKKVMGQEGLSTAEPRYTARGLIRNAQGKYAVMYAANLVSIFRKLFSVFII